MSLTALLGQEPGTGNDDVSHVYHALTLSWISKAESGHSDDDLVDTMDCNLGIDLHPVHQLPMATVLPMSPTPLLATPPDPQDFLDDVSQLSDYSDVQTIRQDIVQAASGTIGRCFLNCYNRASPWVSILQLKSPQPIHTVNAIQELGGQAEAVLRMLFSVGCLPGKAGDASETDSLSASYST